MTLIEKITFVVACIDFMMVGLLWGMYLERKISAKVIGRLVDEVIKLEIEKKFGG